MTAALGVLEATDKSGLFTLDASEPVRPGRGLPALLSLAPHKSPKIDEEQIAKAISAAANRELDRAQSLVEATPSSITFAALAQAHAVLGRDGEALSAARRALNLGLVDGVSREGDEPRVADAVSAGIAAEVMLRFGAAEEVFWALKATCMPRSLHITFAAVASELGHFDEALDVLSSDGGALVESMRGFLFAIKGDHQRAIHHLRIALRDEPNDADAALNLSGSLWAVGSRRKAVAAALRATRTAPGRKDMSLHYLELLLEVGELRRATQEVKAIHAHGVVLDARLLVIQARTFIAAGESAKSIQLLEKAISAANAEDNVILRIEVAANLAVQRLCLNRLTYDEALRTLMALYRESPGHEAVAMCLANVAVRTQDAAALCEVIRSVDGNTSPARRAYLHYQLAWLEGDNEAAGSFATEWFELELNNPIAATSAIVALGIGLERWQEAQKVAEFALSKFSGDLTIVNNAAYVLAMARRAPEAIRLLEPYAESNFVLKATLGLAHLAAGNVDQGMRLYRQAADESEEKDSVWRSLMTTYQALIVRQLGIDRSEPSGKIAALALIPVELPSDWKDQPDFVRLYNLCVKHGYDWPLSL